MTPEEFIKKNPFPNNGAEINEELVTLIKASDSENDRQKNLEKLFKNNARLIWVIHQQYNYNQTLSSMMGFVYEGLVKSCDTYNPKIGMPFYHYAIQTTRGLLQNWYNYRNDIIHIPVVRRRDIKMEYVDVDECSENVFNNMDTDIDFTLELDYLFEEYEGRYKNDKCALQDLNIIRMARKNTYKQISESTGLSTVTIRKSIAKVCQKMREIKKDWE